MTNQKNQNSLLQNAKKLYSKKLIAKNVLTNIETQKKKYVEIKHKKTNAKGKVDKLIYEKQLIKLDKSALKKLNALDAISSVKNKTFKNITEVINYSVKKPSEKLTPEAKKELSEDFKKLYKSYIYSKLRKNRVYYERLGMMFQNPIKKFPENAKLSDIYDDYETMYVNDNFEDILKIAKKALYENKDIINANIQAFMLYTYKVDVHKGFGKIVKEERIGYKYSQAVLFTEEEENNNSQFMPDVEDADVKNHKFVTKSDGSDSQFLLIGYKISYETSTGRTSKQTLKNLKAFKPSSDRKFHALTTSSTTDSKICIYETFLDVTNQLKLKYMRGNQKNKDLIKQKLKAEGSEIEKAVLNGELINSLEMLTKKYDNEIVIRFYNKHSVDEYDCNLIVKKGKTSEMTEQQYNKRNGQPCMLYQKNIHVAPAKIIVIDNKITKKTKASKYILHPSPLIEKEDEEEYDYNDDICGVLGFDAETFPNDKNLCEPFNFTVVGHLDNKQVSKSFYGLNATELLIKYIDSIATKIDNKKTKAHGKVPYIHMYGFNNASFDNMFIYEALYELDPETIFVFTSNSIKYIEYNNIRIFDMRLYYNGSLRGTCDAFKLEEEKGVYPYSFVNKSNIYYKGLVPDKKYWNTRYDKDDVTGKTTVISEYEEYIANNKEKEFDLKSYTEKYCLLDSKLVYRLALLHLSSASGSIDGIKYNVTKCPTSAGVAMKIFNQVFQKEPLVQSPDNIIDHEKGNYKGGRTEVFKRKFETKNGSKLYYYDINSAHPSGMTKDMPFLYIKSMTHCDKKPMEIKNIVDTNNYKIKVIYKGNDKYFIPNLLTRTKEGDIIASQNVEEYDYHWGCEVKEAILNNCEVYCCEYDIYEQKPIFKEFINYFYNERLKIKKTNTALSLFYKNVINSLYGKFGQKCFTKTRLCKDSNEMYDILGKDGKMLGFEMIKDKILFEYETTDDEYSSIGKLVRFASYITATTRCKLSELMRNIGHEHIYYCDTDSIFTDKKPDESFVDQNVLGKWKLETEPIDKAIFLAPKSYFYETELENIARKCKGIDSKRMEVNDYENLESGKVKNISQKNNMFIRSFNGICIKQDQERRISTVLNKRVWNNNESEAFLNIEDWRQSKL